MFDVLRRRAILWGTLRRWDIREDDEGGLWKQCASAKGRRSILMVDDIAVGCVGSMLPP